MKTLHPSDHPLERSELDRIHASPASWFLYLIYFAPQDPRIIVKKRVGALGWTLNFARPLALPTLIAVIGVFMGAFRLAATWDLSQSAQLGIAIVIILALVNFCRWMSNPQRFCR
jgi:hypothetical protein